MDTYRQDPAARPLPTPRDRTGALRKLGVEIEFGGLAEDAAAQLVARRFDRDLHRDGADFQVRDTPFGTCKLYIDTAWRKGAEGDLAKAALDLARTLVPVELVTDPFDPARLPQLDRLVDTLRDAGAYGTEKGLLLGYGLHLNVQIASPDVDHLWSVLTAFALSEPLIRRSFPIDLSRRVLPFVDSYAKPLLDALATGRPGDVDALAALYLRHAPSRNHALDMLPIFAHHDPALIARTFGKDSGISPRPAFHYRMPDCRIDDPYWSVGREWALWVAIEQLAQDGQALERLCAGWRDHRRHLTRTSYDWAVQAAALLREHGHVTLPGGTRATA